MNKKLDKKFEAKKEGLATKVDIRELHERMNNLDVKIEQTNVKIEQTKSSLVMWMFGFWFTLFLALIANFFLKK